MNASGQNEQGRPRERSPLRPERQRTLYGASGAIPRPPRVQPPPPYSATQNPSVGEYRGNHADCSTSHCIPSNPAKRLIACTAIFFSIVLIVAFVKIDQRDEARMGEQRDAMRKEAKHLEEERVALEFATHHWQQERSRLEKQTHLLEDERQLLEKEGLAMRQERERWERARDELTIPKGAFWEAVLPVEDCRAYGKREYWGTLRNIPEGRPEMDACMNMPIEIKGITIRRPHRCQDIAGSVYGFWMVDWDQHDCKPWHQDFVDKGCTNRGSGLRHIEAKVIGINNKGGQDWRLLCETTPMIWNHIKYPSPAHCDDRRRWKIAVWYVPDGRC